MALKYKGLIVGVKSAHYSGPEWEPFARAVEVGTIANIPVMIDFGSNRPSGTVDDLLTKVLPARRHLHAHVRRHPRRTGPEDARPERSDSSTGARSGILFDVGHGGGSFRWRVAVPMMKAGFLPDTISTDLHARSMNAGLKDILNLMSKFLAMGMPLDRGHRGEHLERGQGDQAGAARQPVGRRRRPTSPCCASRRDTFGFVDMHGARLKGTSACAAS